MYYSKRASTVQQRLNPPSKSQLILSWTQLLIISLSWQYYWQRRTIDQLGVVLQEAGIKIKGLKIALLSKERKKKSCTYSAKTWCRLT